MQKSQRVNESNLRWSERRRKGEQCFVFANVRVWNHVRACAVARVRLMKVVALANGMFGGSGGGGAVLDWG